MSPYLLPLRQALDNSVNIALGDNSCEGMNTDFDSVHVESDATQNGPGSEVVDAAEGPMYRRRLALDNSVDVALGDNSCEGMNTDFDSVHVESDATQNGPGSEVVDAAEGPMYRRRLALDNSVDVALGDNSCEGMNTDFDSVHVESDATQNGPGSEVVDAAEGPMYRRRLALDNSVDVALGDNSCEGMNTDFDSVHVESDATPDSEVVAAAENPVYHTRMPANAGTPRTPVYLPQNLSNLGTSRHIAERFFDEPETNTEEPVVRKKKTRKVWSPKPRDLRSRTKTSLEGSSKPDTPRKTPKRKIKKPTTQNKNKRVRRSSERNTDNKDVPQDIDGTGENEEPAPTCEDSARRSGMSPNEEAPRRHVPRNSRNSGSVTNNVGTAERISDTDMPETDMEVILQKKKKKKKTRKSWNPKPRTPRRTKTSLGGSSKLSLTTEPQRRKDMEIHTNATNERNTGVRDASPQRTLEEGIDVIDENEGFAHLSHDPFDGISGPSGYLPQVADSSNSGSHSVQSFVASIQELDADKEAKKMVKVAIKSGKTPLTANAEALRHVLVQAKIAKQTTPLVQALVRARFLVYRHEPK